MSSQEHLNLKDAAYAEAAQYALPNDWEDDRIAASGNTVDSHHTRDKDDTILLAHERGIRRVSVGVADTGTLLRDTPAIEAYAREMGETRYLHAGNIPMIPPRISEGILSILDDKREGGRVVPTPAVTVRMALDSRANTEIAPPQIVREIILPRSYTYAKIASLTAGVGHPDEIRRWKGYETFAQELLARRRAGGALAFYDAEKRLMTDEDGHLVEFRGRNMSGQLIVQEFMILANTAMAGYMARHNIPALYRNHHLRHGADQEELAKLLAGGDVTLNMLRSVYARARYSPHLEGHAGLNLRAYMHFTSPLRRFADFVNHANLAAHLDEREYPYQGDELQEIADHLNKVQDETRRTKRESDVARMTSAAGAVATTATVAKKGKHATRFFSSSLTLAAKTGDLPAMIADEARQRLADDKLRTGDVVALLGGRFAGNESLADLLTSLLKNVATRQGGISAVINNMNQTGTVGKIRFTETPQPGGGFVTEFTLTDDEGTVVSSESAYGLSKAYATQRAGALFIGELNGQKELMDTLVPEGAIENHKSILQEMLAKQGAELPSYATIQTPNGVESTLVVRIGGEVYTFTGEGVDKTTAEQAAAEAARNNTVVSSLPMMAPKKNTAPPRPPKLSKAAKAQISREETLRNPIVQLQNQVVAWHGNAFGADNTEHMPKYDYQRLGTDPQKPEFECTVEVGLADGSTQSFSATDTSKAKAKRAAAAAAMEFIQSNEA